MDNLIRVTDILSSFAVLRNGTKTYDIDDILFSTNGSIQSVIVSGQGIFGIKRCVSSQSIDKITKDSVVIKGTEGIKKQKGRIPQTLSAKRMTKMDVLSETGMRLGMISDFYINIEKERVVAVEVARSLFEDLLTGRTIIPGNVLSFDSNSIRITETQLENSLHNTKGIINVINKSFS